MPTACSISSEAGTAPATSSAALAGAIALLGAAPLSDTACVNVLAPMA